MCLSDWLVLLFFFSLRRIGNRFTLSVHICYPINDIPLLKLLIECLDFTFDLCLVKSRWLQLLSYILLFVFIFKSEINECYFIPLFSGDCRLSQLQSIVRQSGRRGKPPHNTLTHPTKAPKIIARGRSCASDIPPERPPPLKHNPYKMTAYPPLQNGTLGSKSPVQSPVHFSPPISPTLFSTSSPTPCSVNQNRFLPSMSPSKMTLDRGHVQQKHVHSPSISVVQDLLMYKKFQNGLRTPNGHMTVDESIDTTQFEGDGSSTSGSYYIDNPPDDWRHPPVSDIYVWFCSTVHS